MSPSHQPPPPIRACLFDMDGLLLNTEDLYSQATNTVLREHSRPDLPWSIKAQLQGRPGPEAGKIFSAWAQLPISDAEFLARQSELQRELFPTCGPLPGVEELLARLGKAREGGKVELALATSSNSRNFEIKTAHLKHLFAVFPEKQVIKGDDTRIPKGRGKPAPDIYLLALKTINASFAERRGKGEKDVPADITAAECLVFEDSVPGVEAGRRAGMQAIWVPHPGLREEYRGKEREVLAGRSGMEHALLSEGSGDNPGEIDDGWGRMVESLEGFDYKSYGIDA